MKRIINSVVLLAVALASVSCAKYVTEDNVTSQKRIREAWMRVNLGGEIEADENGLYIMDKKVGTGKEIGDTTYCLIDYVARDLEGNGRGCQDDGYLQQNQVLLPGDSADGYI